MRRREFITGLAGVAIATPGAAYAQQPSVPVIGYLSAATSGSIPAVLEAFRQGLAQYGYVEGRNVDILFRWADFRYDRLPSLAADLVGRQVAVIVTTAGAASAVTAKQATNTIPIVFQLGADPVGLGLVASLSRPGGNITGTAHLNVELAPKRLELLHELVPTTSIAALLVNPTNPNAETVSKEVQAAAPTLGIQLQVIQASTDRDFDAVFTTLLKLRAGALAIATDPFFTSRIEQLGALSLRHAMPTIYQYRQFVAAGGLVSYGGSITDSYYKAGVYTGRILKGAKPADLPVQQSTKVELVINLKTAKALGLTVPVSLLGRADELSE